MWRLFENVRKKNVCMFCVKKKKVVYNQTNGMREQKTKPHNKLTRRRVQSIYARSNE